MSTYQAHSYGPMMTPPAVQPDTAEGTPESEMYLGDDGTVAFKRNTLHPNGFYISNPHASSSLTGKHLENY
jgi:hypothetical protein